MSEDGEDAKTAAARRSLALLNAQADAVRAELAGLRRDLAKAKDELGGLRSAQLLEVNAELVQAAVHADSVAQTAVSSLDELARSTQHDELTGAPTRTLMFDRLETAIAMASGARPGSASSSSTSTTSSRSTIRSATPSATGCCSWRRAASKPRCANRTR